MAVFFAPHGMALRVAAINFKTSSNRVELLARAAQLIEAAATQHSAQLVVLPEAFTGLYGVKYFASNAEVWKAKHSGTQLMAQMAAKHHIHVVGGVIEQHPINKKMFNTVAAWSTTPNRKYSNSTGAELLGFRLLSNEILYAKGVYCNLGMMKRDVHHIGLTDASNVAGKATSVGLPMPTEKNLRPDYVIVTQLSDTGVVVPSHLPGPLNPTDPYTKASEENMELLRSFLRGRIPTPLAACIQEAHVRNDKKYEVKTQIPQEVRINFESDFEFLQDWRTRVTEGVENIRNRFLSAGQKVVKKERLKPEKEKTLQGAIRPGPLEKRPKKEKDEEEENLVEK